MFRAPPQRIVSLVPSDTLNVAALGAASALVGRTDYCELPEDIVGRVPSVGGTKNPRIEAILDLRPDLVLANQEENTRKDVERLAQKGVRTLVSFPCRVADGLSHLARLAHVLGVEEDRAVRELLAAGHEVLREAVAAAAGPTPKLPAFCPIWIDPLMTIHGATFISDMMALIGTENVFATRERRYPLLADLGAAPPLPPEKVEGRDTRYPRVTWDEVVERKPWIVLLPDEPYAFGEKEAALLRVLDIPAARRNAIVFVSGKDLCWYGARTVEGLPRLRKVVDGVRGG